MLRDILLPVLQNQGQRTLLPQAQETIQVLIVQLPKARMQRTLIE
jgi:hypothetical protein